MVTHQRLLYKEKCDPLTLQPSFGLLHLTAIPHRFSIQGCKNLKLLTAHTGSENLENSQSTSSCQHRLLEKFPTMMAKRTCKTAPLPG